MQTVLQILSLNSQRTKATVSYLLAIAEALDRALPAPYHSQNPTHVLPQGFVGPPSLGEAAGAGERGTGLGFRSAGGVRLETWELSPLLWPAWGHLTSPQLLTFGEASPAGSVSPANPVGGFGCGKGVSVLAPPPAASLVGQEPRPSGL